MNEINKTEEFLKSLSELALKRKQRIKTLDLIKVWNFLSEQKKQEFAERIIDLAECYERSQINDNLKEKCSNKGHNYGPWINEGPYWYRICKKCNNYEQTDNEPVKEKNKLKKLFKIKKPI